MIQVQAPFVCKSQLNNECNGKCSSFGLETWFKNSRCSQCSMKSKFSSSSKSDTKYMLMASQKRLSNQKNKINKKSFITPPPKYPKQGTLLLETPKIKRKVKSLTALQMSEQSEQLSFHCKYHSHVDSVTDTINFKQEEDYAVDLEEVPDIKYKIH